jgi:hypothetical protein
MQMGLIVTEMLNRNRGSRACTLIQLDYKQIACKPS